MKRESQSEPTFWSKTGGALVKLRRRRRRRRAVLTFSAAAVPQLFWRRGATGVGLYLQST